MTLIEMGQRLADVMDKAEQDLDGWDGQYQSLSRIRSNMRCALVEWYKTKLQEKKYEHQS